MYGVAQRADEIATSPAAPRRSPSLIGIATSIVAALIPARQAARVDPVQALQKGKYQVLSAGESRLRVRSPAACSAPSSIGCLIVGESRHGVLRRLRASPSLPRCCWVRCCRWRWRAHCVPLLKWLRPVEGALAADSLIQAPRRTSASVAALMLSLALVVAFAGMARASYASIIDWMDTTLNPDLFVTPSQDIVVRTLRFPPEMEPSWRHARHRRACSRSATRGSCSGRRR